MLRRSSLAAFGCVLSGALFSFILSGCGEDALLFTRALDSASVRVYLVNDSTTEYLTANLGLCPQGLSSGGHRFVDQQPVLAPGESISYAMWEIGGVDGLCDEASADYMIGLCGWDSGTDPAALTHFARRYGGQIGVMFDCGDTVILRWTDGGEDCGTWTSSVLTAPGNEPPASGFQLLPEDGTSCAE